MGENKALRKKAVKPCIEYDFLFFCDNKVSNSIQKIRVNFSPLFCDWRRVNELCIPRGLRTKSIACSTFHPLCVQKVAQLSRFPPFMTQNDAFVTPLSANAPVVALMETEVENLYANLTHEMSKTPFFVTKNLSNFQGETFPFLWSKLLREIFDLILVEFYEPFQRLWLIEIQHRLTKLVEFIFQFRNGDPFIVAKSILVALKKGIFWVKI